MCDACENAPEWIAGQPEDSKSDRKRTAAPVRGQPSSTANELLEYLREWRRERSVRDNVPAFMILHDTALEDLSRKLPQTSADLLRVSGIGEKKAAALGDDILEALQAYRNGARASQREEAKTSPAEETIRMLSEGHSFEEIARLRERRLQTVIDLVAELVERGRLEFNDAWIPTARREQVEAVIQRIGVARMKSIKDELPPEITYGEIRLVVARSRARPG
jgi:ATP-dependent DNA helicase RecQ